MEVGLIAEMALFFIERLLGFATVIGKMSRIVISGKHLSGFIIFFAQQSSCR